MEQTYDRIRQRACRIVSRFPLPDFYKDHTLANNLSRNNLKTNPIIIKLKLAVSRHLEDDFGHGIKHAVKVAVDAGSLMIIENNPAGISNNVPDRRLISVQCAALLHDLMRKYDNHAIRGAEYARKVLKHYPLSPLEIDNISQAIRNHEAFKRTVEIIDPEGILVSDCLYDADKFRWGPDNFTDTIWAMVSFSKIPLKDFLKFYPEGMKKLAGIKDTFRTNTGKKYGPQFIDIGIAAGEELFKIINTEFKHLL